MLASGAVVAGAHVAYEGILQARGAVCGCASGGDDVLAGGAVVPGAHVAFEGILQARGAVCGRASGGDDVQCVGVQVVVMMCLLVVQ